MFVKDKDGRQYEVIEAIQSNMDYIEEKISSRLRQMIDGKITEKDMFFLVQKDGDYSLHRLDDLKANYKEVAE